MMYGSWYIKQRRTEFFVILDHFLLFYPLNNPKNKNFEKIKKVPRDIIILHQCTINDNHMMHGSWNMKRDRQIFLSFWTVFCPFTPLTTWIIKILKNWKKHQEISSFYTSVTKIMIICSLLHLMHAIAHAHASTCATSLMHVKNSMSHFYL